jgi:flagellar hook protein FlgE
MTLQLNATGTYTLNYTDGAGASKTATALATAVEDGKISFEVASKDLASTATITVPLDTAPATGYNIPNDSTLVTLGSATPAVYNLTAKTFDKSGAVVTLTDTWDSAAATPDTQITFGDIDIEIDPAEFETTLDSGVQDVSVGNIGPGAGLPVKLAQIASVKFTNPDGLSQDGQGYFVGTTNSGLPVATIPGSGGTGTFRAGALEMSNVDLSREFTEMIITQRGFQANTRMITVSDEMLSELISMKR